MIGPSNASTLAQLWVRQVGAVNGSPALAGGGIDVLGTTPTEATQVSALNPTSGVSIWTRTLVGTFGAQTGATLDQGSLYFGTGDYVLHSLNSQTGATRWSMPVGGIPSNAAVSGGLVYVAANTFVLALNARTGAKVWRSVSLKGPVVGTPTVSNGLVYEAGWPRLYALNAATGKVVWTYKTGGAIEFSSAVIAGGLVYVASGDMYLYAVDAATGVLAWKSSLGPQLFSAPPSPSVADGVVFASGNGAIQAFDATIGSPIWSTTIANFAGSPVVANGVVYAAGGDEGGLYALDEASGALLWSYFTGGIVGDPIVANGLVYAGSADRNLFAFGLPAG